MFLNNPLVIKNIITEGYTDEMKRAIVFFTNEKKITDERCTDRSFSLVN